MSTRLRHDQECGEADCGRPARHAGICTPCYLTASPAVRATADLLDRLDAPHFTPFKMPVARDALEAMYRAPAYGEHG